MTVTIEEVNQDPVLTTPVEFQEDVLNRLGRANGNVYHRRPGAAGAHDGQIMVRLKKKRFIVIDYGIEPDKVSMSVSNTKHVVIPAGAGRQKCSTPDCTKIGIPILLYDSSPKEPASLYLRSGLCFTCQRSLNEKRRTQRKRKTDIPQNSDKKKMMNLSASAVIIDTPPHPTCKPHGADYGIYEIAVDVDSELKETFKHVQRLIQSLQSTQKTVPKEAVAAAAAIAANTLATSSSPTAVSKEAVAAAIFASSSPPTTVSKEAVPEPQNNDVLSQYQDAINLAASNPPTDMKEAVAAAIFAASSPPPTTTSTTASKGAAAPEPPNDDVMSHYQDAMNSMKKCVFLLKEFKASWNSSNLQQQQSSNMIPLLLAADAKGDQTPPSNNDVTNTFGAMEEEEMDGMRIATV